MARLKFDLFFGEVVPQEHPIVKFIYTRAHVEVNEGGMPMVCLARVAPKAQCTFPLDMMQTHDGHAPGWGDGAPPGKTLEDLEPYKQRILAEIQAQLPGVLVILDPPEKYEKGWVKVATYDGDAPDGSPSANLPPLPDPGFGQPEITDPSIPPSLN